MIEHRNSINSVMVSDDSITDCSERGFSDMEQGQASSSDLRGILRVSYESPEERHAMQFRIAKLCLAIITIIICTPIILFDLLYAYTDKSCVDIYPNKLDINMKTYLLVCGYLGIVDLFIIIVSILFTSNINQTTNIYIYTVNVIIDILIKIFLEVWTIIGAIIFWGTLYQMDACSKSTNNYLFATLIIKLVLISLNIKNKKNDNKKK